MEKQLLCDECDLAFAKTSALKEHKQVQHEGAVLFLMKQVSDLDDLVA